MLSLRACNSLFQTRNVRNYATGKSNIIKHTETKKHEVNITPEPERNDWGETREEEAERLEKSKRTKAFVKKRIQIEKQNQQILKTNKQTNKPVYMKDDELLKSLASKHDPSKIVKKYGLFA
eukprot:TRINITY_DN760_c0_g1_i1.p1 TRINITY_DN760_c0_g1~~TRINITY_DN760_c0_g1_i1.p1  ORF type:complete len:134 (+),score=43.46 TRINITY_DN760_c0_g1_i1:37-402(+)